MSLSLSPTAWAGWSTWQSDWRLSDGNWGAMSTIYDDTFKSENESTSVNAFIGHSKSGNQRIYIRLSKLGYGQVCSPETFPKSRVAKIDDQAIKMIVWCDKYTDSKDTYMTLSPESDAGSRYLLNRFKTASKSVWFSYDGYACPISAKGFSKAWASSGGNAL